MSRTAAKHHIDKQMHGFRAHAIGRRGKVHGTDWHGEVVELA